VHRGSDEQSVDEDRGIRHRYRHNDKRDVWRASRFGKRSRALRLSEQIAESGEQEQLHGEAVEAAVRVSLATVYNTLQQFIEAGVLREVVVNSGRSYFDTNVSDHHHFFFEDSGHLLDIPGEHAAVSACRSLPRAPSSVAST
jgi:Ferric uptake regulator family